MSIFWNELFTLMGSDIRRSSTYHPQTDGQSEVVNRCLETYLRCFSSDKPSHWSKWLSWAEYNYNTSYHTAAKMSPFKIVYGREPTPLLPYEPYSTVNFEVDQSLIQRDATLLKLKHHLNRAQQRMKDQADAHRKDVMFEEGDMVFVKLKPYRQSTLARRLNDKLVLRYYGPYKVLKKVSTVSYKLELPSTVRIHSVFLFRC